tara:strand:+ start:19825 stop:20073 length:249 start_codon:yes stop_codon:yes gene_type:complete
LSLTKNDKAKVDELVKRHEDINKNYRTMINDVQIHTNGAFSRNELLDMPIRDFLEIKEMLQENIDKQKQQMNQRKGKITTQL